MLFTTLCYIEQDGRYLMLHRTKKNNDVNHDKWIGVGGKPEGNEAPEECLIREVFEETGLHLTSFRYRGLLTFVYEEKEPEYIFTYTAEAGEVLCSGGTQAGLKECTEGELSWIPKREIGTLSLWEGDRAMFRLLFAERREPFSLKLCYDRSDRLLRVKELSGAYADISLSGLSEGL